MKKSKKDEVKILVLGRQITGIILVNSFMKKILWYDYAFVYYILSFSRYNRYIKRGLWWKGKLCKTLV